MVRIRSEHAIGFLKGRFHSLKGLRINIKNEKMHKFATYWIASCVGLHAFAMQCESDENSNGEDNTQDPFIDEGLSSSSSESEGPASRLQCRSRRLQEGQKRREKLKRRLFRAKAKD